MSDVTSVAGDEAAPAPKPEPKGKTIERLLRRARGASLTELAEATGWQQHSIRAFLTGLRKKGRSITKEPRRSGQTSYRTVKPGPVPVKQA